METTYQQVIDSANRYALRMLKAHGVQYQIKGDKVLGLEYVYIDPQTGKTREKWTNVTRMSKTQLLMWLGYDKYQIEEMC